MRVILTLFIAAFLPSHVIANDLLSTSEISPPTISLNNPGLKDIALVELNVDSEVMANIATSTYELVFFNPNSRVLEGELVFSLFDGQNVTDYALQINGKYRAASAVPKAKAKEAFETTIRAKIDPGLLEKTVGNNFKTRIYPIPAKGYKRVKVTVQEMLDAKQGKLRYRMPFVSKAALKQLRLNVMLVDLKQKPVINQDGFGFDKVAQGYSLKLSKKDAVISKPITIELMANNTQGVFVKTLGNEKYVLASLPEDKQLALLLKNRVRRQSNNIAVIWSSSYSNRARNTKKDLDFLEAVLKQNAFSNVQLIFHSNQQDKLANTLRICGKSAQCQAGQSITHLKKLIQRKRFDGTSDYSQIDISQIKADEVLFFSNGITTIHEDAELKNIDKPLTLINSSLQADAALLKKYASLSNGRFLDLTKLDTSEALKMYAKSPVQLNVLGASGNMDKNDVYLQVQNERLNVLSKMEKTAGNYLGWVKIEVAAGNRRLTRQVKFPNPIAVNQRIDKLWAARKIEALGVDAKRNKQQMIRLAKQYKVLTKDMSLIVLDRVEDYVRYEIQPPHELRAKYANLMKHKVNKKKHDKDLALIESIKLLRGQNIWYRKTFDKTKPKPPKPVIATNSGSAQESESVDAQIPASVQAVAPRAMAPQPVRRAPAPVRRAAPRAPAAKKVASDQKAVLKAKITLKSFNPNAAYIKQIKRSDRAKWVEMYHQLKAGYLKQPMFYVDVADLFYKNDLKPQAIAILSNVLELDFENSEFLRVFAFKAMELGQYDLAVKALEKVKKLRPFEPQSGRDLALAYEKFNQPQKSLNELYSILISKWDDRFNGIKIVVINELNHLLAKHKNLDKRKIDTRLLSELVVDLRVVINWSSDNTDIDLWVFDPYGEKTYYSNKQSRIGGKISNDMTRGYGPEEFMIKDAVPGVYQIKADYFGNTQQKAAIPVTIRAEIYSNYSKPSEVQQDIVLRLSNKKAVINVGSVRYAE